MPQAFKFILILVVAISVKVSFTELFLIKAGKVYDNKTKTFDRSNIKSNGQDNGGATTSVFILEAGSTIKNVSIGVNQAEGMHCFS
ncbi:hypothetical protein CCR75_000534 [Bremia lactucae]|uniref:Probable pectate lyase F n=1 Tax=Bremia lactucae TaxID=4779 RepID=A0A976IJ76_BRELC|nr:hypothetical protein CCR75_000534 [Bremia lactucae]